MNLFITFNNHCLDNDKKNAISFALMSIFCVSGGEFFRYAQNPPPLTQNIGTIAVTVSTNANNSHKKKNTNVKI